MEAKPERLQKILAAAGLASRRKAEELIAAGLVSVNGHTITAPGTKADPRLDEIRVDGKLLRGPERQVYLAVYKPKGHVTTVSDPEGRPTVMDLLKSVEERVFPVGRLDYMSEGLLLLTNDGDLMAQLTKAGSHVAKTYMVKVSGKPKEEEIDKLRDGIMLPPEPGLTGARGRKQPGVERRSFAILTQPAVIQLAVDQENPWYEVTLTEGRNRQIRRMFEQIGYHIEKIKRVRYGSLTLDLEPGEFRHLTPKEVNQLRKSLDTPFKPKPIKVKRRDERPERTARVDAARFVKGRRGKPSADAAAPTPFTRRPAVGATRGPDASRRDFAASDNRGERSGFASPRGPEFARDTRRDHAPAAGSAALPDHAPTKRPYPRKTAGGFGSRPAGGFAERPQRSYGSKPAGERRSGGFERKSGSFARKPVGDFAPRKTYAKREGESDGAEKKRGAATGGFGFSKFSRPKFVKPSTHRDLGSDKTDNFERKPFSSDRPFSKDRPADPRFAKKPGSWTGERKYSKGPGKPGAYAPRPAGDFKRPGSGDFKRSGESRPGGRSGGFGKSFGAGRTSSGSAGGKSPRFGEKRSGFAPPRGGSGGTRRPSSPPRGGRTPGFPPRTPRRRPEEE